MRYLIDGYNWFFSSSLFSNNHFVNEHEEFIIKAKSLLASLKAESVLVFDGDPCFGEKSTGPSFGVTIFYTGKKQSADEYILEMLRFRKSGPFTLVSSDVALIQAAKDLGAKTCSPSCFEKWLQGKQHRFDSTYSDPFMNEYYIKIFSERLSLLDEDFSE